MVNIQDITAKIAWCNDYIEQFRKEKTFDPFDALMGTESREQRLFNTCVMFLWDIENAIDNFDKLRGCNYGK